jgi:hypothetical protein
VYFTTALKSNELMMERLQRWQFFRMYPEDEDLLEDVITENQQAIEMVNISTNILTSTMDAFASIISNNLNAVMKFLASATIVVNLPTIVYSFFGMNVDLPFQTWNSCSRWVSMVISARDHLYLPAPRLVLVVLNQASCKTYWPVGDPTGHLFCCLSLYNRFTRCSGCYNRPNRGERYGEQKNGKMAGVSCRTGISRRQAPQDDVLQLGI